MTEWEQASFGLIGGMLTMLLVMGACELPGLFRLLFWPDRKGRPPMSTARYKAEISPILEEFYNRKD